MGAENLLLQLISKAAQNAEDAGKPTTLEFGEVVSDEYAPLEIQIHDKLILDEDFLELTNAVRDHWVDVEVYWETIDDNDLSEFQANHYSNVAIQNANVVTHNTNSETYNNHTHTGNMGIPTPLEGAKMAPVTPQITRHTSHLHNIAGRKRMRVYNGLHKGEKVVLLRMRGGQKYLVLDRITDHIVGGEWRTHAGAVLADQERPPFVPAGLPGWQEGATSESKWPNFSKPPKFAPGAPGPQQ
jgi:hypothetical protein